MDYTPPPFDDGFTAEKLFCQGYSYIYEDVIFLPHYIDFPTDAVQLATRVSHNVPLNIPRVASPMDTVSEAHMAVAMAALGGITFIHSNTTPSDQAAMVRSAKSRRVPILSSPVFKPPYGRIESLDDSGDSPTAQHEWEKRRRHRRREIFRRGDRMGEEAFVEWELLTDSNDYFLLLRSYSRLLVPNQGFAGQNQGFARNLGF